MKIVPAATVHFMCILIVPAFVLVSDPSDGYCSADDPASCSDIEKSFSTEAGIEDVHQTQASTKPSQDIRVENSVSGAKPETTTQKSRKNREKYYKLIQEALEAYIPCTVQLGTEEKTCFKDVVHSDLLPYRTRSTHGITKAMIDQASQRGVLYQIINHYLYRQKACSFPSRCSGIEHFLLKLVHILPDMELVINVHDYPQVSIHEPNPYPVFSFSKTPKYQDILCPAWTFWEGGPAIASYPRGLGRWDEMRERLSESSEKYQWENKKSVGFFRGSRTSGERDPLVLLSRRWPDLVDAKYTKNQAWKSENDTLGDEPASEVKLEDHCEYKYLYNFRGVAASFRFKHLFLCNSLVFHVGQDWVEFFYSALKPWVHFVPVKNDISDVEELLEFAKDNDGLVRQIADRGKEFVFRHLRMADVELYWKHLLLDYSSLLKYSVSKRDNVVTITSSN
ncbi:hypothetical protein RvY_13378 [Ramazzottius varieornatus]|uniref:Glycosyl transferase CAP10 domain-containing protein n=1 Tax=Ramazzottius varieornatus TaxID=947166 RepID=A0A1D1VPU0_RAMVA|nr:hypothetical protein RvY_13378 [Ramazzottius varieornatus]